MKYSAFTCELNVSKISSNKTTGTVSKPPFSLNNTSDVNLRLLLTVMQYATLACERPFRDRTFSKAASQYAINLPTFVDARPCLAASTSRHNLYTQ